MASAAAERVRSQARGTAHQQTLSPSDPINSDWIIKESFAGPFLFVDEVTRPTTVAAGGTVDVGVTVVNTAISQGGPDQCRDGGKLGFEYTVRVEPSWTAAEEQTVCHSNSESRDGQRLSFDFAFDAPDEPGDYELDVSVAGVESGDEGAGTFIVTVPDEGGDRRPDGEPVSPDPGDGGDGDSSGGNFLDGLFGGGGGFTIGLVTGLAGLVVLLVLLTVAGE